MRSYNAAYLSALCLVAIQVSIGCIMRASQTSGRYTFSTSSSVTISEFFKFLISSGLITRSCMRQRNRYPRTHESIPTSSISDESKETHVDMESDMLMHKHEVGIEKHSLLRAYMASLKKVSVENRIGFVKLALLYALINNTVRLCIPGGVSMKKY